MTTLTEDSLELMKVFEQRTNAKAVDVVEESGNIVFIVQEGDLGKAIGRKGETLFRLRESFNPRNVEVIEDAADWRSMIEKTLRGAVIRNISQEADNIVINVDSKTRGIAIGRNGSNIKKLKIALKRKFGIQDARIV